MTSRTRPHGRLFLVALLACALPAGAARAADPAKPPAGFVDGSAFAACASADGELVEVNVSGRILQALAGSLGNSADPEERALAEMLTKLHSIRAIVAEVDPKRAAEAAKLIESVAADLTGKGWEDIARVRSKTEKIRVLGLPQGDKFGGLTVMLIDADEDGTGSQLVFANIAGPFDLSQLGALGGTLNVPGLSEAVGEDLGSAGGDAADDAKAAGDGTKGSKKSTREE